MPLVVSSRDFFRRETRAETPSKRRTYFVGLWAVSLLGSLGCLSEPTSLRPD